jgi:hypothetical protein
MGIEHTTLIKLKIAVTDEDFTVVASPRRTFYLCKRMAALVLQVGTHSDYKRERQWALHFYNSIIDSHFYCTVKYSSN